MSEKPTISHLVQPRRPRGRPKASDLAALEARFKLVGRQLFFRDGYGATTMSHIAEAARTSKRTLYSKFPSKSALLSAIVAELVASWDTGDHHTPLEGCKTLRDLLLEYGGLILRAGVSPDLMHLNRVLTSESGRFPELAEIARVRNQRGVDYLAQKIEEFADREGVPCSDPRAAAEFFLMTMTGWSAVATIENRTIKAQERAAWLERAVRIFLASRASW